MFINRYKKIICLLVIISFLCPIAFFLEPKKANAVYPVFDAKNYVVNAKTALSSATSAAIDETIAAKEYVLDGLAFAVAKLALRQITTSIVNWINSGFDGSPSFITDHEGFLTDMADTLIGEYIYNSSRLKFLCSPFSLDVKLALDFQFREPYRAKCTLSDVVDNVDNALDDLGNDWKWGTWASITSSQNNNAYGAYLQAHQNLTTILAENKERKEMEMSWGSGFLSHKKCETTTTRVCDDYYTWECWDEDKETCTVQTPGSTIQDALGDTLSFGTDTLVIADEIDEIIGALLMQLLESVIGPEGLLAQDPGSYPDDEIPPGLQDEILDMINDSIATEEEYKAVKGGSLAAVTQAENLLLDLIDCWENNIWLTAAEKQAEIAEAQAIINTQIMPLKTTLDSDIAVSVQNITDLNAIKVKVGSATTLAEITAYYNEYDDLKPNLHDETDVFYAEVERSGADGKGGIIKTMDTLNQQTVSEKTLCETAPTT